MRGLRLFGEVKGPAMPSVQAISAKVKDISMKPSWPSEPQAKYHWVILVNAVLELKDPTVELSPLFQRHTIMKYICMTIASVH